MITNLQRACRKACPIGCPTTNSFLECSGHGDCKRTPQKGCTQEATCRLLSRPTGPFEWLGQCVLFFQLVKDAFCNRIYNHLCSATCACLDGWSGIDCSTNTAEMLQKDMQPENQALVSHVGVSSRACSRLLTVLLALTEGVLLSV